MFFYLTVNPRLKSWADRPSNLKANRFNGLMLGAKRIRVTVTHVLLHDNLTIALIVSDVSGWPG